MKRFANIFVLVSVAAVALCSCDKTESEITEFVQGFAQAVEDGDKDEIAKKTGQYKTDLDDVENAKRMADTGSCNGSRIRQKQM